jgi:hypothetical protein
MLQPISYSGRLSANGWGNIQGNVLQNWLGGAQMGDWVRFVPGPLVG